VKYQLTRNDIRPSYAGHPLGWVPDEMAEFIEWREVFSSGRVQRMAFWRCDVVFDNEWGPEMVRAGIAVPLDDECRNACERTAEQIAAAQKAYARTNAGIHPEDFEAYDKGYMVGYRDGKWIPGPNYAEWEAQQRALEEEEEI